MCVNHPEGRIRFAGRHLFLLIASWGILVLVRLGLVLLPFRTVVLRRGGYLPARRRSLSPEVAVRAIGMAGRLVPGSTCLSRSLALKFLLRVAGIRSTLWIGVGPTPSVEFQAHAWLEADGRVLLGESKRGSFIPMVAIEDRAS